MQTKRKVTRVVGRIDPDALYTVEGCMRYAGIGRDELRVAREWGVTPFTCGKRRYYRGDQLIAFIVSKSEELAQLLAERNRRGRS